MRKSLIGDHVIHGARLVVNSGYGVVVQRVEDPVRGVGEGRRHVQGKAQPGVDATVAPAAVHGHVGR
jgi:hypothetical protein